MERDRCIFDSPQCLCQWCEDPCNNGLNCHECRQKTTQQHDIYTGTYPWGTHSDEIRKRAEEMLEKED